MSEMVKRLGKVIYNCPDSWSSEEIARAAIEAMREPTAAMVAAGNKLTDWASGADDAWEAMIDEALK